MVVNSQRTLFAIDLEQHRLFNQPYTPLENTTLNEKFSILDRVSPDTNIYPCLNMFVIGVGGLQNIANEDKYSYSQHSPIDGALFEHIPFIVRDVSADLTPTEKSNYRLRVIKNVNNKEYVCYYGKVIPKPDIKQTFYTIKTINDVTQVTAPTLTTFDTKTSEILNPKPRSRGFSFKTVTGIDYITKLNKLDFVLNISDIKEIKEGCKKLNIEKDIVTELGLCTSCDYDYNGYTEATYAQIAFHIGVNFNMGVMLDNEQKIQKSIELGGLEPYIK